MRKRNIKKQFWINEEEAKLLSLNSAKAKLNESEYIREILLGYKLKEKPDDRFYRYLKIFSSIANNMNQISKKAHSLGFIDELAYRRNYERLISFIDELKKEYLINSKD